MKLTDIQIAQKLTAKYANALKRGIHFNLSFKRMKQLCKQKTCFFTGIKFHEYIKPLEPGETEHPYAMTIDRIDSSLGYTDDNVVACTNEFNKLKSNLSLQTIERMYKGVQKVIERNKEKEQKTGKEQLRPVVLRKAV